MQFKGVHTWGWKEMITSETTGKRSNIKMLVAVVLAVWLALVFILGAKGWFVRSPGTPPIPILFGATIPLVVFFGAYFASSAFKTFVLSADLRLGAMIQSWRVAGLGFLALYAHGVLPGFFALPAGLGDIAIGVTAPWIALLLIRYPAFARSQLFVLWNVLGILDLVVAVGTGATSSGFAPGLTGNVTTTPMSRMPLVLVPAYLVPLFVMLHATALFQSRRFEAALENSATK